MSRVPPTPCLLHHLAGLLACWLAGLLGPGFLGPGSCVRGSWVLGSCVRGSSVLHRWSATTRRGVAMWCQQSQHHAAQAIITPPCKKKGWPGKRGRLALHGAVNAATSRRCISRLHFGKRRRGRCLVSSSIRQPSTPSEEASFAVGGRHATSGVSTAAVGARAHEDASVRICCSTDVALHLVRAPARGIGTSRGRAPVMAYA